jgi:hypothetical protein
VPIKQKYGRILRGIADVYSAADAKEKFVHGFAAAAASTPSNSLEGRPGLTESRPVHRPRRAAMDGPWPPQPATTSAPAFGRLGLWCATTQRRRQHEGGADEQHDATIGIRCRRNRMTAAVMVRCAWP